MTRKAKIENGNWKMGEGRSRFLTSLGMTILNLWQGFREWSGDAAYEKYAASAVRRREGSMLSREEFYLEQLEKKYSRVSRCC